MPSRHPPLLAGITLSTIIALSIASPSAAAAEPALVIELNKLEQNGEACRLTLLVGNSLGTRIKQLDLELALFGADNRLSKLLAVPAGSFPPGKTRVRQFDIAATPCPSIARILLNTITACAGDGLTPDTCLDRASTRSATAIPLSY